MATQFDKFISLIYSFNSFDAFRILSSMFLQKSDDLQSLFDSSSKIR